VPRAIADYLGLVFYFWSQEAGGGSLEPVHVHISRGAPAPHATKVWIRPDGTLEVANNDSHLKPKELASALEYIALNRNDIIAAWYDHFGK